MDFRRSGVPVLAGALALTGLGVVEAAATGAAPSSAADPACRVATTLVLDTPKHEFALPGGAEARVWDTGDLKHNIDEARFVAVTIPRGSLIPRAVTASTLTNKATPKAQARSNPRAVLVVNGAVFHPSGPATPRRAQIVGGTIRKATADVDQGLALYEGSRTAEIASHNLVATATSSFGELPVGAWNWQTLSPYGVTVYTHDWGSSHHPVGHRTVVVKDGLVSRVIAGRKYGRQRPAPGTYSLTAPYGSETSAALALLTEGTPVEMSASEDGTLPFLAGKPAMGVPDSLIGVSSAIVRRGVNYAGCGTRDNKLRPRTAVAWDANGNLIVAAVAGRSHKDGVRSGGASVSQWADYLLHLGAVNAVNLDGGSSTTLLVRRVVGGQLQRLDSDPDKTRQVPVADSLTFLAPAPGTPSVVLSTSDQASERSVREAAVQSGETPTDGGE